MTVRVSVLLCLDDLNIKINFTFKNSWEQWI